MKPMTLILTLPALLALAAQPTALAAQQTAAYGLSGVGTATHTSGYNAHVNWSEPSRVTSKGGLNLTVVQDGKVVRRVKTGQVLPKIESVTPDLTSPPVPVWGYVKNFTIKYSSRGSCSPTLTVETTPIVVTVTETTLTVECPQKGYTYSGTAQPANPFKLQRVK